MALTPAAPQTASGRRHYRVVGVQQAVISFFTKVWTPCHALPHRQQLEQQRSQLQALRGEEAKQEAVAREARERAAALRADASAAHQQSGLVSALMAAKARGEVSGVFGRLGGCWACAWPVGGPVLGMQGAYLLACWLCSAEQICWCWLGTPQRLAPLGFIGDLGAIHHGYGVGVAQVPSPFPLSALR